MSSLSSSPSSSPTITTMFASSSNSVVSLLSSPFQWNCLQGQIAIVTGGGSGIGYEITKQLLQHGCDGIMILGRRENFLQQACQTLQSLYPNKLIHYSVCDIRIPSQCQNSIHQFQHEYFPNQGLDILVNCAAGNFLSPAELLSPKGFATVMAIDTNGTFNMCHVCYPLLRQQRRNHKQLPSVIINISATLQYGATFHQVHASAAKSAVDSLTRSLALEWGYSGEEERPIRVVGIAPGPIANTPGTMKLSGSSSSSDKQQEEYIQKMIPLQRMGDTIEIGYGVVFACVTPYLTGHTIVIDGGEHLYRKGPVLPKDAIRQYTQQMETKSRSLLFDHHPSSTNNTKQPPTPTIQSSL